MSEQKLRACEFCKSINVKLHNNLDYVYCKNCGARGPVFDGHPEDAVQAWNTRSTDKVLDEVLEEARGIIWDKVSLSKNANEALSYKDLEQIINQKKDRL